MADEQTIKLDLTTPQPDLVNGDQVKGGVSQIPDLSDTWDHKAFNKLPIKEQMSRLSGHFPGIESYTPMDYQNYRDRIKKPINSELRLKQPSFLDHAINFARPVIAGGLAGVAGSATGAATRVPTLATAASAGTYGITDALLQHLQSSPPESLSSSLLEKMGMDDPISRTLANTGESAAMGKLGSMVLNPVMKGAGALYRAGNADLTSAVSQKMGGWSDEAFQAYNPTYSQLFKSITGKPAPVSKWVEDTFNNTYKAKLLANAGTLGKGELQDLAKKATGGELDSHILSSDIADNTLQNLHKSTQFTNLQDSIASKIADTNTHIMPVEEGLSQVKGPIQLGNTQLFATQTLNNLTSKYSGDLSKMQPEDKLIFKEATRLVNQKGKIGFDEANSAMKLWENTGYKNPPIAKQTGSSFDAGKTEPLTGVTQFYRQLNDTMSKDIDQSIGQWRNGAVIAQKAFREGLDAISQRRAIFGGDSASNAFLDNPQSFVPALNKALQSPKALDDVLKSGEITLPNGVIHSTDTQSKVAGYALNKLITESTTDDLAGGVSKFNTASFAKKWMDPDFAQVKNRLFTPGAQSSVEQILNNINAIDAPGTSGTLKYLAVHKGGLAISSAVVGGLFGGSAMHGIESGVIAGGLIFGGTGLAKLLSKPGAAKVLVAMSAGKIPEGMTRTGMDTILRRALNGAVVYGIGKSGESTGQFQVNHDELVQK